MNTIAYYDGNNNNNVTFAELEQELETAGLVVTENGYGYDAMSGAPRNAKQLEWLI